MYPEVFGARSGATHWAVALMLLALALSTVGLGCGARPAPDSVAAERTGADPGAASANGSPARIASFSADRAWRDLQALTDIGARPVGSSGNDRARDYLSAELEDLGVEVESWEVDYASAAGRPAVCR